MKRLKIYFMHSTKFDYNNIIYKKVLSSSVCLNHELILPLSDKYKGKYAKDLIKEADLIVVFLNNPSFGLDLELRWLSNENKRVLCLSLDNNIKSKYLKRYTNINIVNSNSFIHLVEKLIVDNQIEEKYDDVYVLGNIN